MFKIAKFGFVCSLFVALGCTDASVGTKVVTNTVTVTVTVTGDGGGKPDDNVGGHEAAGGEGGASATASTTTTSSNDMGKGGAGGTPVTTTTTQSGTGGAATTTTSSTSSTTSTTSSTSTSSTTTSTTTTTSTSTVTGGPQKVTLHVFDVPPGSGNHTFDTFAFATPADPAVQWGAVPNWTGFGTQTQIDVTVTENTNVFLGLVIDPPAGSNPSQGAYWTGQGCDPAKLLLTHAMWTSVTINGVTYPAAPLQVKSNGMGGCWIMATAAVSQYLSASDQDGDGYSPNDANPALRDCNDFHAGVHPGAVETPQTADNVDFDCDGSINPTRDIVVMQIAFSDLAPTVNSATGGTYPMKWDANHKWYATSPIERVNGKKPNPAEFWVSWPKTADPYAYCVANTCYDSSYWGGACHADLIQAMFMTQEGTNILIPLTLKVVNNPTSCHWFSQ